MKACATCAISLFDTDNHWGEDTGRELIEKGIWPS